MEQQRTDGKGRKRLIVKGGSRLRKKFGGLGRAGPRVGGKGRWQSVDPKVGDQDQARRCAPGGCWLDLSTCEGLPTRQSKSCPRCSPGAHPGPTCKHLARWWQCPAPFPFRTPPYGCGDDGLRPGGWAWGRAVLLAPQGQGEKELHMRPPAIKQKQDLDTAQNTELFVAVVCLCCLGVGVCGGALISLSSDHRTVPWVYVRDIVHGE